VKNVSKVLILHAFLVFEQTLNNCQIKSKVFQITTR